MMGKLTSNAVLSWAPLNAINNIVSYKINLGAASLKYTKSATVGPTVLYAPILTLFPTLTSGTYYLSISQLSSSGQVSVISKEISFTITIPAVVDPSIGVSITG